ncbi:MAG: hypothetical protein AAGA75_17500 [Cyanobacteria bacterium P01_E01_bin.6]
MATYITEYEKKDNEGISRWSGLRIEADTLQQADAIAASILNIEQSLNNPKFSNVKVVGRLVGVSPSDKTEVIWIKSEE